MARVRREDDGETPSGRNTLTAMMTGDAFRSIETTVGLRDDASAETPPKVRLDADVWCAGLAAAVPGQKPIVLEPARTRVIEEQTMDQDQGDAPRDGPGAEELWTLSETWRAKRQRSACVPHRPRPSRLTSDAATSW